jgi:hypothetical protein
VQLSSGALFGDGCRLNVLMPPNHDEYIRAGGGLNLRIMKTSLLALAVAAVFALTSSAQAGDHHHKKKHSDRDHHRNSRAYQSYGHSYDLHYVQPERHYDYSRRSHHHHDDHGYSRHRDSGVTLRFGF